MVQELELDALVKAGIFRSKSEVVDEALRLLFATRPQLRTEAAIQLLKDGQVTLARAAEIAGVTRWEFEEILADHGLQRLSGKPTPPASAPGQVSGRRKE